MSTYSTYLLSSGLNFEVFTIEFWSHRTPHLYDRMCIHAETEGSVQVHFLRKAVMGQLHGAMVVHLTPDQKVACLNHVGVTIYFTVTPHN